MRTASYRRYWPLSSAALHSRPMVGSTHRHCAGIVLLAMAAGVRAETSPAVAQPAAAGFIEFQSEADGRCQILSEGGKLRVLYNRHDSRAIDYRLMRVFGDGHRQGWVVGTAPAGGERVPLGCTRVDGRPQDWQLERATFSP